MAGLSNFISNTATQSTTMPSWYDQAQQQVVNQATQGAANVPALANTVAGGAIQNLQGPQNPFLQAQGTLGQIASGAANPWIVSGTGQVTPNVATPLGGLFQAQNQQLNQLMPNITAPVEGANIASGQFGSLRGQTAVEKAKADAQAKLFADQMQAALQSQQIGTQAATGLGNVGAQGVTSMTNLGQAQQADPLLAASALGKILGGMQVGTTQQNVTNLSPLNQIGSIASALGGSVSGTNALLKNLGIQGGLGGFFKGIALGNKGSLPGVDTAGQGQTVVPIDTSGGGYGEPVAGTGAGGGAGPGQVLGTDGNIYNDPSYGTGTVSTPEDNAQQLIDAGFTQDPETGDWVLP